MNIKTVSTSLLNFVKNKVHKDSLLRLGFYFLTVTFITLKGIYFLGFILNKSCFNLNFPLGYREANPFLNYYIGFAILFLSFGLLFKGIGKSIYMIIINLLFTFLIIVDLWYFRGFLTVPSALIITQTSNMDNMGGSFLSFASNYDFIFIFDFIILISYIVIFRKNFKKVKSNLVGFLIAFIIPLIYIGYIPFNINILHREVKNDYIFSNYDPTNTTRYFSPIGYHVFDLYNVYKNSKPYELTSDDKKDIEEYYKFKNENLPDNKYKAMFKGSNLLVIQVESLESFVINQKVDGKEITPNLNKLLNNSIYFKNTFEQVNEGTSSDSDLMVNTSMLPLRRGTAFYRYPNTTYHSLPNLLEEKGYETTAIHPDRGSFWNYSSGLKGIGFNNFIDYYSFDNSEVFGAGISDGTYLKQVAPLIKKMKQPFYTFTVTLTSHGPFELPEKYRELGLTGELKDNILGGYFESVHYTDKHIGIFLDTLDKEGLLDNTTVVVVGDHTGVHKYYNDKIEKLSNPEKWWLDNGNHTVPFIIYNKNLKEPLKSDIYGGQIDIMPTILYLMGIDDSKYTNSALGRNLLNTNRSSAVLTDKTIKGTVNNEEKEQLNKVLDISDKLIRSNYFK
ncbi:uncharacterized sulfatase [Clostridium cavendishii DSM 21758]|uniref:Uncharacterized sulfatase n=1 Tax=Clostridium cavendishii DSM 21758 TaxID=1121302 RepID=A0A1M6U9S6_9CLOT|nr:LTA synthase family protein [Clostridium cavendishii]SHK66015.1 uncharacterized sulfatase [Clostridium cavendishii DSM 21758]